jgi:CHAD domain-containing protein
MSSYERATLGGMDIEALHNMRVSARRLKAMMKLFRGCFPKNKFRYHYNTIRGLLRTLGDARDSDVFVSMLVEQKQSLSSRDQRAIDLLIARGKQLQKERRKLVSQRLKSLADLMYEQKYQRFLEKSLRAG